MKFQFTIDSKDFVLFQRFVTKRGLKKSRSPKAMIPIWVLLLILFLLVFNIERFGMFIDWPSAIGGAIFVGTVMASLTTLYTFRLKKAMQPLQDGVMLGEKSAEVDEYGIVEKNHVSKISVPWTSVREIVEATKHIYLFIDSTFAIIFPKRAFSSEDELTSFMDFVKRNAGTRG